MSERHPSETDLALLAGGDCGRLRQFFLNRHVARCGDCRDVVASFGELRAAVLQAPVADMNWDRLAGEMRANIRVGLAAGECVREIPAEGSAHRGWKPQMAIGMAGVLLLAGAGVFLRGLLPHDSFRGMAHAAVLQSTGAGVQVQMDSGSSMTLLNPLPNHGEAAGDQTVTSQGAIRASYVDGNTGTVTVTSVYAE
jgi:hypothetical protein